MSPELHALYEIHRQQILLNCADSDGEFRFHKAYVYALDSRMFPYFHENWCRGEDPFIPCYEVSKKFIADVVAYLDDLWVKNLHSVPSFYDLEKKYGTDQRFRLIKILRYSYLNGGFDKSFYSQILSQFKHPSEAGSICADYRACDVLLV